MCLYVYVSVWLTDSITMVFLGPTARGCVNFFFDQVTFFSLFFALNPGEYKPWNLQMDFLSKPNNQQTFSFPGRNVRSVHSSFLPLSSPLPQQHTYTCMFCHSHKPANPISIVTICGVTCQTAVSHDCSVELFITACVHAAPALQDAGAMPVPRHKRLKWHSPQQLSVPLVTSQRVSSRNTLFSSIDPKSDEHNNSKHCTILLSHFGEVN